MLFSKESHTAAMAVTSVMSPSVIDANKGLRSTHERTGTRQQATHAKDMAE
ncbi:MAG: hypothetical protein JST45_05130 [Bacteroidetes bacterium]|nr:hypothetical protein [Bacteroidota bacterium]